MNLKITDNTFNKYINDLEDGDLFVVCEAERDQYKLFQGIYMKVSNRMDNRNAVKLNNGTLFAINNTMLLQKVHGELVI